MAKLKVYRTPIGFHDAYVAAPSQKAALAAWGADANLFARGQAEQVDDPALMEAPLASPGTVVRITRGSAAEHLDALPADAPARGRGRRTAAAGETDGGTKRARGKPKHRPAPERPSRKPVDTAEAAVETLERDHRSTLAELRREEARLVEKRRRAESDHARERDRLVARLDAAQRAWRQAMDAWREATGDRA